MNLEEAREVLKEAELYVDYINLGRTISALAGRQTWKTFDNNKWRPNKNQALLDSKWLNENMERVFEALQQFNKERNVTTNI